MRSRGGEMDPGAGGNERAMAVSTELLVVGTAALLSLAACVVSKSSLDDGANIEGPGSTSTTTSGGGSASPDDVNPSSKLDLGLPDGAEGQAFDLGSDDDIGGGVQFDLGEGGDETPSKFDFGGGGGDDGPKFDLGDGGDDGSKLDLGDGGDGEVKFDVGG